MSERQHSNHKKTGIYKSRGLHMTSNTGGIPLLMKSSKFTAQIEHFNIRNLYNLIALTLHYKVKMNTFLNTCMRLLAVFIFEIHTFIIYKAKMSVFSQKRGT